MNYDRIDLNKYYKFVKVCCVCRKDYGMDLKSERLMKDICPDCITKIRRKKS